jgi:hypothetical protein
LAGAGSAVFLTFCLTTMQQQVPVNSLARVLGAGAAWAVLSSAVVLALPLARSVRWRPGDGRGAPDAGPGHRGRSGRIDDQAPPVS